MSVVKNVYLEAMPTSIFVNDDDDDKIVVACCHCVLGMVWPPVKCGCAGLRMCGCLNG